MSDGKKGDQNLEAPFHVVHKLPAGDSPYVRAKHVQVFNLELIHQVHITNCKDHNSLLFIFDVSFRSISVPCMDVYLLFAPSFCRFWCWISFSAVQIRSVLNVD